MEYIEERTPQVIDFAVDGSFADKLPEILSNIEAVKQWVTQQTEADRALVLETQEDIDKAKKRCADINRVIEGISKKRIEVKKAYNAPYMEFEKKLNEVVSVLAEAKDNLWYQVCVEDEKKKKEKSEEIKAYYSDIMGDLLQYKSYEAALLENPKWLNKGTSIDVCKSQCDGIKLRISQEVYCIKSLNSKNEAALLMRYGEGQTLASIIEYDRQLNAMITKAKEEQKKEDNGELLTVDFRVECTSRQLSALKDFLIINKIKYGKVPEKTTKRKTKKDEVNQDGGI